MFFVDVVDPTKSTYNVYRKKNCAENIIVGPVDPTEKPRTSQKSFAVKVLGRGEFNKNCVCAENVFVDL
jgi:hypothetical protein